jgi:beta-lactamase regulating signal transducer with metallopeptidase domain
MQHAVLEYLLNAGWQLLLVAGAALLLARLLKLEPGQACWLWLAAFGLAVLAPVLAMAPGADGAAPSGTGQGWGNIIIPPRVAFALSIAFWLCLAGAALRLVASCVVAIRLVRDSRPVWLPGEVRETLQDFCRQHGHALPRIHTCSRITSPLVVGARRPFVLVPPNVLAEGPEALAPALLHELAHVMRGDYATNLAVELFALPLSWHPALHAIKAMIRLTREQSCDAIAAARIGCRRSYAQSLLTLARNAIAPEADAGVSMALFGDNDLQSRIALLTAKGERRRLSGLRAAATAAVFLALGAIVTHVHVSALAPVPVVVAAGRPLVVAAAPRMAAAGPVRVALIAAPARKARGHAHVRTDVQLAQIRPQLVKPVPDTRIALANTIPSAALPGEVSGWESAFDFLQPFQVLKYRTISP